jgi:hypothetical protein
MPVISATYGSLFSGEPSVVSYGHLIAEHAADILNEAVSKALSQEVSDVRDLASRTSGYQGIANHISITYDPDTQTFTYGVDGDAAAQAADAEYGTPETAPSGLLRKRMASGELETRINKELDRIMS